MKPISGAQIQIINIMLSQYGLKDEKDSIIKEATNGRTGSIRELTMEEAASVISWFKKMDPNEQKADKMRKKILAMAHEMHWKTNTGKVDMKHVNNWCQASGYLHKKLDAYTVDELPKLVTQFEKVYKDFISKL